MTLWYLLRENRSPEMTTFNVDQSHAQEVHSLIENANQREEIKKSLS